MNLHRIVYLTIDKQSVIREVNRVGVPALGLERQSLINTPIYLFVHQRYRYTLLPTLC